MYAYTQSNANANCCWVITAPSQLFTSSFRHHRQPHHSTTRTSSYTQSIKHITPLLQPCVLPPVICNDNSSKQNNNNDNNDNNENTNDWDESWNDFSKKRSGGVFQFSNDTQINKQINNNTNDNENERMNNLISLWSNENSFLFAIFIIFLIALFYLYIYFNV